MFEAKRRAFAVLVVVAGLVIGACGGEKSGGVEKGASSAPDAEEDAPEPVKLDAALIERYIATSEEMTAFRTRVAEGHPPTEEERVATAKKHGFTYPEWIRLNKGVSTAVSVWHACQSRDLALKKLDELKGKISDEELAKKRAVVPSVDMKGYTDADMELIGKYDEKIEASW